MQIEVSGLVIFAFVLSYYLAVGVDISLFDIVAGIKLHKYNGQIAHDIDNILASPSYG